MIVYICDVCKEEKDSLIDLTKVNYSVDGADPDLTLNNQLATATIKEVCTKCRKSLIENYRLARIAADKAFREIYN